MKRILLACFLLTAVCSMSAITRSSAQVVHVTAAAFTTQVNLLDSYIGAGNMTAATATWDTVHHMMIEVLSYSKNSINLATTPSDKAAFLAILDTQRNLYKAILPLKSDLAANRTLLHSKLGEFDATIY
jgi:hypothetical protein